MAKAVRAVFLILVVAVFLNVVSIDYFLIKTAKENSLAQADIRSEITGLREKVLEGIFLTERKDERKFESATPTPFLLPTPQGVCPLPCQSQIDRLSKDVEKKVIAVLTPGVSSAESNFVREVYVPLGTATLKNTSYTKTGAQAYIDLSKYPSVKAIYFEAVLKIPTANGTVYARLVNVTDSNTPVAGSEIFTTAASATLLSSGNISLPIGSKLYAVQLRTTMDYEAVMEIARVRIILQ